MKIIYIIFIFIVSLSAEELNFNNQILLKCNQNILCKEYIIKKYLFNNISKLTNTIYVVTLKNKNNIQNIANELQNDNNIIYAHPNYIKVIKRR